MTYPGQLTQEFPDLLSQADPATQFNADQYDWQTHIRLALAALPAKKVTVDRLWSYYDGDHPRVWLTDSIRKSLAETIQQLKLCGAELQQIRVLNMVKTRRNWNQT